MSSLLNKLKGGSKDHSSHNQDQQYQQTGTDYNSTHSGYDNNSTGYGNNTGNQEPYVHNTHSDGAPYVPPKGTHVGQQSAGNEPVHNSNLMNRVDPRVSNQPGDQNTSQPGYGQSRYDQSGYDQSGHHGTHHGSNTQYNNPQSENLGPHKSDALNRADPRVDSDGSKRYESSGQGYGTTTTTTTTMSGYDDQYDNQGRRHVGVGQHENQRNVPGPAPTTAGPHKSDMMNKLDPKVDSDQSKLDNSRQGYGETGYGQSGQTHREHTGHDGYNQTGHTGGDGHSHNTHHHSHKDEYATAGTAGGAGYAGTHNALDRDNHDSVMNRSRPSREAEREHEMEQANIPGPAPTTAGPHKSDILNKLDPRVDSDQSKLRDENITQTGYDDSTRTGTGHTGQSRFNDVHSGAHDNTRTHDNTHESHHHGHHDKEYAGAGAGSAAGYAAGSNTSGRDYDRPSAKQYDNTSIPGPAPTTAGPHKSDMLNKLDPKVDSDQSKLQKRENESYGNTYGNERERELNEGTRADRRHDQPYGQGQTTSLPHRKAVNESGSYGNDIPNMGSSGMGGGNTFECIKCGHHNTHLGRGNNQSSSEITPGSGRNENTAGPHNSSFLNRADPRVDSDVSGGKTYGGNQTYR